MPGVIRTRVGYAGGTRKNPTYRSLGDHTECLQVDFQPDRLSDRELLEVFWERHDPTRQSPSRQYMNVVLLHYERQREAMRQLIRDRDYDGLRDVATRVESLEKFYRAEAYHQKYYLRQDDALSTVVDGWSDRRITDFPGSMLLNAMAAGHLGSRTVLERSRDLGLSSEFTESIRDLQANPSSGTSVNTA